MLQDFSIKIVDKHGKYIRMLTVSAFDSQIAMMIAAEHLSNNENEFVGGF